MLKEVRMSRKRLIGSLTLVSCCLALVIVLAVWAFPLKGAPIAAQSGPKTGIAGGVSGGVKSGVSGGVAAGVEGGIISVVMPQKAHRSMNPMWIYRQSGPTP